MKTFQQYIKEETKEFLPNEILMFASRMETLKTSKVNPNRDYSFYMFPFFFGSKIADLFDQYDSKSPALKIDRKKIGEIIASGKLYEKEIKEIQAEAKTLERKYGGKTLLSRLKSPYGHSYKFLIEDRLNDFLKLLKDIKDKTSFWKSLDLAASKSKGYPIEGKTEIAVYDINMKLKEKGQAENLSSFIGVHLNGFWCPCLGLYVIKDFKSSGPGFNITGFAFAI